MKCFSISFFFVLVCLSTFVSAQQTLVYNHYFLNPFLYNPSYIAPSGYTEVYVNYRNQWSGIKGAPTTGTFNLQVPLSYKTGFGLTAYQDKAGLLKTTTGLLSFSYQIFFGQTVSMTNKLGFGISVGATHSFVDSNDPADAAVANNNTTSIDGQFGINYQYNRFKIAFAIPRLFDSKVASQSSFNTPSLATINNTLSSVSYDIPLGNKLSVEPYFIYRTYQTTKPQYEAMGVVRLKNIGWVGGSYRQDYGAAALIGFSIKDKIKLGYAYEFATNQTDALGSGSHEFQLVVRVGKKQKVRPDPIATKNNQHQPVVAKEDSSAVKQPVKEEQVAAVKETEQPVQKPEEVAAQKEDEQISQVPMPETIDTTSLAKQDSVAKTPQKNLLPSGYYVVIGVFQSVENARNYKTTLRKSGYPAEIAYHPGKGYYIIHMGNVPTIEKARELRNLYRQKSRYSFKDTWILVIE